MAVGRGKEDDLGNVYDILGIEDQDCDDKAIKAAYRAFSIKLHPDKNPDDPNAAEKFDQLTRAKDLLLDPEKRAEVDRVRKARVELEERFAQEDSKRRKLREDLESREGTAARGDGNVTIRKAAQESAEETRKRFVQEDFAKRLLARKAELAGKEARLVAAAGAAAAGVRGEAEAAKVRISWREGASVSEKVIREVLTGFCLRSLEMGAPGELSAVALLESREDALRVVLHCRERKHSLPFRLAAGATVAKPPPPAKAVASKKQGRDAAAAAPAKGAAFGKWEQEMLAGLASLAAAQRKGGNKVPKAPGKAAATLEA